MEISRGINQQNSREDKKLLRREILAKRDAMPELKRESYSALITEKVKNHEAYLTCKSLLTYVTFGSEVDTKPLILRALQDGKKVYCPRVCGNKMLFFQIKDMEDLCPGYRGILEPKEGLNPLETDEGKCLLLMPGSVFDRNRNRMGYGKGFYDRFLEECEDKQLQITTLAVAFSMQLVQNVPVEAHDRKPQYLITENECIDMQEERIMDLNRMGEAAVAAKYTLQKLTTAEKNRGLLAVAKSLCEQKDKILEANRKDIEAGEEKGMHPGLIDRLRLTESRIEAMAEGLKQIVELFDPIGEVMDEFKRPNGLNIQKRRVPLGVIGIIYESRPNVTADAFGLCFKTGNAVILKGGSDALSSNTAITEVIRECLEKEGITPDAIQLIQSTDRAVTAEFMRMNRYVDVLIPRGGAGLIRSVVENSTVPVIETGTGNCHIYVDETADLSMATEIIMNAKTQRIGVCNACESLVIHEAVAKEFLPVLGDKLKEKNVEIRGDKKVKEWISDCVDAVEEDYGTEYLDYILSMKTVSDIDEAIAHINKYNTKHSEAIITENERNAEKFLNEVDAACVYVNASTRFTDGFEFGFGAEIGISTQKLHARGPMGLKELTSYKYIVVGNGQVRK